MKNLKRTLPLLMLLLIPLLMLSSCTSTATEIEEDPTLRQMTEKLVNHMIANEKNAVIDMVANIEDQENFDESYTQIAEHFDGITSYELSLVSAEEGKDSGITYHRHLYLLFSEERNLAISIASVVDGDKVSSFQVGVADNDTLTMTEVSGTVGTLKESSGLQIILMVVSLVEILFIAAVAIDCARHKIESKALWLLFIIIGIVTLTFTYGEGTFFMGFKINFILSYTSLVGHMGGLSSVRVMLPVGAVAYLILRKKLLRPKATEAPKATYSYHTESYIEDNPVETQNPTDETQPTVDSKETPFDKTQPSVDAESFEKSEENE